MFCHGSNSSNERQVLTSTKLELDRGQVGDAAAMWQSYPYLFQAITLYLGFLCNIDVALFCGATHPIAGV